MSTPTDAIHAIQVIIPIFCITTMFAFGLDVTLTEILAPFSNKLAMAIIVLASNIIIPLCAVIILVAPTVLPGELPEKLKDLITLTPQGQIGFLLVALAAGGIVSPALVGLAKGKVDLAKGTTLLLLLATMIFMPLEIGFLRQSGLLGATLMAPWSVFNTLLLFQLLPLVVGVVIKSQYAALAAQLRPWISQLATLAFLVLLLLLPATGVGPITWPQKFSAVEVPLLTPAATPEPTLITALKAEQKGNELAAAFEETLQTVSITTNAQVSREQDRWALSDNDKLYVVVTGTHNITVSAVMPYWFSIKPDTGQTVASIIPGGERMTDTLKLAFEAHTVTLTNTPAITGVHNVEKLWKLTVGDQWYVLKQTDQGLNIHSQTLQQTGIVADLLQWVFKPQTTAAIIAFVKNLGIVAAPFVAYVAVALILLTIGYYAGVLINNANGVTVSAVAHTQALAAAVRNVVAALLVASRDLYPPSDQDFSAIAIILVFYTVGLIMAAIQADRWSREPETAPAAPAGQPQAAVIAPERGVTSTS